MAAWKTPPKAKIYEALTAVGEGRIRLTESGKAEVASSDGAKTYLVEWSNDLRGITSNDNASYWQGYMGYPIIAVLMVLGRLDFKKEIAQLLSGIPWKEMNRKFRNDYQEAIESVLSAIVAEGGSRDMIVDEVDGIMAQIETMELEKLPRRGRPPK